MCSWFSNTSVSGTESMPGTWRLLRQSSPWHPSEGMKLGIQQRSEWPRALHSSVQLKHRSAPVDNLKKNMFNNFFNKQDKVRQKSNFLHSFSTPSTIRIHATCSSTPSARALFSFTVINIKLNLGVKRKPMNTDMHSVKQPHGNTGSYFYKQMLLLNVKKIFCFGVFFY